MTHKLFYPGRKPVLRESQRHEVWEILLETRNIAETARHFNCCFTTMRKFMRRYPCPDDLNPNFEAEKEETRGDKIKRLIRRL